MPLCALCSRALHDANTSFWKPELCYRCAVDSYIQGYYQLRLPGF